MEIKKFSSFEAIDKELEILKLERELNYEKLVLSIYMTKDNLKPKALFSELLGSYKSILSSSFSLLLSAAIPYIINWFKNKKRGD
jgi:hypothetical protein